MNERVVPVCFRPWRIGLFVAFLVCASLSLQGQATTPVLVWPQPAPIPYQTPLSGVQLNAQALSAAPVQVSLTSSANVMGITTPGYSFLGGFDYDSWAYAEELIGSSITWDGVQFAVGPPNVNDVVSGAGGGPVPLPEGSYGQLLMIGDLVNNEQPPTGTFVVTYTDGSTTTLTQNMSDWVNPRNYPGETVVQCYPWRHNLDGTNDPNSVCAYGYSITLDPTKTVQSLTLPNDRDIVMIAFDLLPQAVQGTMSYNPASGTVLPSGTATLNAAFTPANAAAYTSANASVQLTITPPATPVTPVITWPAPAPIVVGTPLSATQLDASAAVTDGPALVPIVPQSRVNAIYEDGTVFEEKGFDGNSNAYSGNQLGSSLSYAGFTFPLGPLAVPDASTSATIPLPAGSFTTLYMLGAGANGAQMDQPFTIHYTDGSTSVTSVSLSSWTTPQSFPGETIVASTTYADTATGGEVSGIYDVYGYQIPVDSTKTVASLTMPANTDVILLALGLGNGGSQSAQGSYVYTPPSGTVLPLGTNPLSVTFTPVDTTDLGPVTATNQITVVKPTLVVSANNVTRYYGAPNPTFTGTITGQQPGDTFTESFSTTAMQTSSPGTYSIVPSASGSDLAAYTVTINDGTLTVTQAPVVASVSSSVSSEIQGQTDTLTATVQSTTTGTPTGTVQFLCNGVLLGTQTLANGTATLQTAGLAVGTDTISIVYSGDVDFLGATASTSNTVLVTSADFTFSAMAGTTLTDTWGKSASLMLQVSPLSTVYYSNITFSLNSALPPDATSSFSPNMVAANAGPTQVAFTYNSKLLSQGKAMRRPGSSPLVPVLCGLVLLPLAATRRLRKHRGIAGLMAILLAIAMVPTLSGCGSGYDNFTYPLTVTATDGVHTHSLTITLKVTTQ